MKIDQAIIDEYLRREKNGWDSNRAIIFEKLVSTIKNSVPNWSLSEVALYYWALNHDGEHKDTYWRDRLDINTKRNTPKVYSDRTGLIEFILFFELHDNIDSILNDFGYESLNIFNKKEWAAQTAIKIKAQYPNCTVYMLYKELLKDFETIDNMEYDRAMCLTSRAKEYYLRINTIEEAKHFVEKFKPEFDRVRVTRYVILWILFFQLENHYTFSEISDEIFDTEDFVLSYGERDILTVLSLQENLEELIKFDANIVKRIVTDPNLHSKILSEANLRVEYLEYRNGKTIFDYILKVYRNNADIVDHYIYNCCLSYIRKQTHYRKTIENLSAKERLAYHSDCIKVIRGELEKSIQNCALAKALLRETNQKSKEDMNQLADLLQGEFDMIKEISLTKSISRELFLFAIIFSISRDTIDECVKDLFTPDGIEEDIRTHINELLYLSGLRELDINMGKLDYLLCKAIWQVSHYDEYRKKDYPFRDYVIDLLKEISIQESNNTKEMLF